MDYLKDYNITDKQIENITKSLENKNIVLDTFLYSPERVESILDLFKEIGVVNLFDVIMTSPSLFCDTVSSVKNRINNYGNKEELGKLINEDANNLILADLM